MGIGRNLGPLIGMKMSDAVGPIFRLPWLKASYVRTKFDSFVGFNPLNKFEGPPSNHARFPKPRVR